MSIWIQLRTALAAAGASTVLRQPLRDRDGPDRGIRVRALLQTGAVAIAALAALASNANASPPAATTIAATVAQFGPPPDFQGSWQSSGAISDAGSFVETEFHFTGALAHSPVVGAFQAVIEFAGSQGTIAIRQQAQFTGASEGTWQIASGTGEYDGARGHGTFAFAAPNSLTFTGVISTAGWRRTGGVRT
jgi:hypothetical protein